MKPFFFENIELTNTFGTVGGIRVDGYNSAMLLRLVFGYQYYRTTDVRSYGDTYLVYSLGEQIIKQEFVYRLLCT
jgi:hypothetical protein